MVRFNSNNSADSSIKVGDKVWVDYHRKPVSGDELANSLYIIEQGKYDNHILRTEFKRSEVIEVMSLSTLDYDLMLSNLSADYPFLMGKGGCVDNVAQCIAITAPHRQPLYINPEGAFYARYAGYGVLVKESPKESS